MGCFADIDARLTPHDNQSLLHDEIFFAYLVRAFLILYFTFCSGARCSLSDDERNRTTVAVQVGEFAHWWCCTFRLIPEQRPDIYAPFLNISLFDQDAVTPGYIFLGPYQTFQEAIYIYDNRGVCFAAENVRRDLS